MNKILIIEDDEKLREQLEEFLIKNGYEVECIYNFASLKKDLIIKNIDLILLDLNLPVLDGHYLCKHIRQNSDTPIIVITSKNTEIDELMSINVGADDFITKPFNTQILLARINSILRRTYSFYHDKITISGVTLDTLKSSVSSKKDSNKIVELTKNEFRILHFMFQNSNKIVSREDIITHLWDSEMFVDDNTLTVNINRLRNKLEEIGIDNFIETRRGQGYIINED